MALVFGPDGSHKFVPRVAMTNAERQAEFRKRNPGYYQRLHAKRRARINANVAQMQAVMQIIAVKPEPLMLPAPVVTIEIPGITTPTMAEMLDAIPLR